MKFEKISYLSWAKTRGGFTVDLSRSGMESGGFEVGGEEGVREAGGVLNGHHPYGYEPLIEKIARRFSVKRENVVPTLGTSAAIFLVCAALLKPGDEVIVEKPAYEPLLAVPRSFGAVVKRLERKFDKRYRVDAERMLSLLRPRTRLVVLTNLHNPTGVLTPEKDMRTTALMLKRRNIFLFVDEVYLAFLEGYRKKSAFSLEENVVTASSLTKVYGLGGLRGGWVLAPSALAERIRWIIDYIYVEGVFPGEKIACRLFGRLDDIHAKNRKRIEKNRKIVGDFIKSDHRVEWVEPDGGVVCFPRIRGGKAGDKTADILLSKYGTRVVPGSFFEDPACIRLGFGIKTDVLRQGLKNLKSALDFLSA